MSIFSLALRNARAKSGRGIIITIILTSMLISGVLNIGVCIQQTNLNAVIDAHSDSHAKFSGLTLEQIDFLRNRVEVESYVLAIGPDGHLRPLPDSPIALPFQSASPIENDPSMTIASGHGPIHENEILLFPHTAELLGISPTVGDRLDLFLTDRGGQPQPFSFVISGILEEKPVWAAMNLHNLIVSEAFALSQAQLPKAYNPDAKTGATDYSTLSVRYRSGYDPYETTERLAALAGITNVARDARTNEGYLTASMQSPQMLVPILAILLLFVLVGALVIYNIFNIQLIRRVRQTGLLSVIGASRGQIFGCAMLEASVQTLAALPLGLLLGAALTRISVAGVLTMALPGAALVLSYAPIAFLAAALVTLLTVLLSVLLPALRVSRVAPVEAVRFSGAMESSRRRRHYDELSLPRLSRINLWRNKGRTMVTIIALTLCGALFIGVSMVGGSLLAGVEQLARKGMAGDMQITANPFFDGDPVLSEVFVDQIAAIDGVTGAHPIFYRDNIALDRSEIEGESRLSDTAILGYDDAMLRDQLAALKEGAPTLEQMNADAALFVQFIADDRLGIGKVAALTQFDWDDQGNPTEEPLELEIVGVVDTEAIRARLDSYSMYNLIMANEALLKLDPSASIGRLAIDVDAAKHDEVTQAISQMCDGHEQIYFQTLKDAIEEQRGSMMGMLMLLYAIIAVLGLVGFLNLANTTLVGIEQRRAELGVLSALGVDGVGLRKLLWSESRRIAITCTAAAITLGSALGYLGTLAMRNIGATYIRFTPPVWQSVLLITLLFLIPFWITYRAGGKLSDEGTVSLLRVE